MKRIENRMAAHEYFSKLYLFLKDFVISESTGEQRNQTDLTDSNLDNIYNPTYRINSVIGNFIKKDLLSIMKAAANAEYNKHHRRTLKKSYLWVMTMTYSIFFLEENQKLEDINENFTAENFWEFTKEIHDSLSKESKISWALMYEQLEDEKITQEDFAKANFFHLEIPRFHMRNSSKICYVKLYEHLDGNISGALKSWYAKKMTSVLKTA